MMGGVIVVEHLRKSYKNLLAVDDVSFTCQPGQVVGFLGPNGAGKSTTLRILTGLTPATGGTATIGGYAYRDIPNPALQVGTLLDASAFHNGRTGRETLLLSARTMGLSDARVGQLLDLVGLTQQEAGRRVGHYSLGMRQRLGVANALLGDPKVLILDEPVNGLDPAGIHWMRGVLRGFADAGGTVLLSSHLLHEIELIADYLIVIGQGRIMAQGTKDALTGEPGTAVSSDDDAALAQLLTAAGIACRPENGGLYAESDPATVGALVASSSIALTELRRAGTGNLERMYLELTSGAQRDVPGAPGFAPPPGYAPQVGYAPPPGFAPPPGPGYAPPAAPPQYTQPYPPGPAGPGYPGGHA